MLNPLLHFNPLLKNAKKTLYVNRQLLNGDAVQAWGASAGLPSTLAPDDMHVTIAFSKEPVDWDQFTPDQNELVVENGQRDVHQFPSKAMVNGATVLRFGSDALQERHANFRGGGASWDHPSYQPHITLTYALPADEVGSIKPYAGKLVFGPEQFKEVDDGWAAKITESTTNPLMRKAKCS